MIDPTLPNQREYEEAIELLGEATVTVDGLVDRVEAYSNAQKQEAPTTGDLGTLWVFGDALRIYGQVVVDDARKITGDQSLLGSVNEAREAAPQ